MRAALHSPATAPFTASETKNKNKQKQTKTTPPEQQITAAT